MLKGCLYRKLFGDDEMFGKKKKEIDQVQIPPPQPPQMYPQQPQPQFQPQSQFQQPIPQMMPIETPTPFCISERATIQTPQMLPSESGQFVPSGQMEMKQQIRIIHNLSIEDLLTIISGTPLDSAINMKVKDLLKRLMK
jgi:hypothetical protein